MNCLKCGTVKGAYASIDFGPGNKVNESFSYQRQYAPHGPLINTEFYPGWLDHWGEAHSRVPTDKVVKTLQQMLSIGVNVNFYMFHGGTNFGFTSGNFNQTRIDYHFLLSPGAAPEYSPMPTSYDYDAPVSEAGLFICSY